jgi:hypothetical protein
MCSLCSLRTRRRMRLKHKTSTCLALDHHFVHHVAPLDKLKLPSDLLVLCKPHLQCLFHELGRGTAAARSVIWCLGCCLLATGCTPVSIHRLAGCEVCCQPSFELLGEWRGSIE